VDIDQCAALSRHLEANLDRDVEDFELTVTSVGLTSPFKTLRQYKKFEGEEVEVLTKKGEKMTGTLKSSDPEGFTITVTKKMKPEGAKRKVEVVENIRFAFNEVKHTKYLIRFK
jgi:ribosome maturation factor RimP